jgi:hypothetical protein
MSPRFVATRETQRFILYDTHLENSTRCTYDPFATFARGGEVPNVNTMPQVLANWRRSLIGRVVKKLKHQLNQDECLFSGTLTATFESLRLNGSTILSDTLFPFWGPLEEDGVGFTLPSNVFG